MRASGVSRSDIPETAYRERRVLVTGHTGFKGAWLTLWLAESGAEVTGLALAPEIPSLYSDARVSDVCRHIEGDTRDPVVVADALGASGADVVFHLAAQSLVRVSYRRPLETFETNVMGTANLLEAVRAARRPCAVVVVTSDKCYAPAPRERLREEDRLGGTDPYSASKAACEVLVQSFRSSFFPAGRINDHGVAVATARAGNVIGGGDWAADRIVPDAMRALAAGSPILVRNPSFVRPWQHVLEPLGGYLLLGARLMGIGGRDRAAYADAWNFGPSSAAERPVRELVESLIREWGSGRWEEVPTADAPPETTSLRLDITKAGRDLGWTPRWQFARAVAETVRWYRAKMNGATAEELRRLCREQIREFVGERIREQEMTS